MPANKKSVKRKPPAKSKRKPASFKRTSPIKNMVLFAVVFGVVSGGYLLYKSYAAAAVYDTVGQSQLKADPKRGISYKGLRLIKATADHPCAGIFEITGMTDSTGEQMCSPGPAPARAGIDVTNATQTQANLQNLSARLALPDVSEQAARNTYATWGAVTRANEPISPQTFIRAAKNPFINSFGENSHTKAINSKACGSVDGKRVVLVYAYAGADNYNTVKPYMIDLTKYLNGAFLVNYFERGGKGPYAVRWLPESTTNCTPKVIKIKIPNTTGNDDAEYYTVLNTLKNNGNNNPDRKYLVWLDGPAPGSQLNMCGASTGYPDSTPIPSKNRNVTKVGYAMVGKPCWSIHNSLHELTHILGGVSPASPHGTKFGHCYDEVEYMCYDDSSPNYGAKVYWPCEYDTIAVGSLVAYNIDCNNNDYYNPAPPPGSYLSTHWSISSSPFLQR